MPQQGIELQFPRRPELKANDYKDGHVMRFAKVVILWFAFQISCRSLRPMNYYNCLKQNKALKISGYEKDEICISLGYYITMNFVTQKVT
jgi:hypothetical protein